MSSKTIVTGRNPFRAVMHLDWARPPLTENGRYHPMEKARITKDIRTTASLLSRDIPALDKIRVGLVWVVSTKHRRDVDNLISTFKPLCDGISDADVVPDDKPEFMVKTMPEIRYDPFVPAHLELTIEEVPE